MILDPASAAALLFDCDGTLVDTHGIYRICWHEVFAQHGFEMSNDWYDQWGSHSMEPFIHAAIPDADAALCELLARESVDLFLESTHLLEPLEHVVEIAQKYSGSVPMAVVSGGPRSGVVPSLEAVGIEHLFDFIITADEVTTAKPAPDGYLLAARLLGVRPEDCIAYEDSSVGIASAHAAGITTIVDIRQIVVG